MENLIEEGVGNIVTEVLLPPIKRHFDYVWRFDDNIEGLKEEECSLKRQRCEMESTIEGARRLRAESITPEAQGWLNESTRKLEEAERIWGGSGDLKFWHVISRYKVGKSAKEAAQGISRLRDRGKSMRVHESAPPASMASISHRPTMEFKSRTRNEEDIMEYLKDANVRVIAACGAGGVGKTTVARRIEERVKKEKLFDEVVHVVVSQQIDMIKIQKEIAEILGLKLKSDTFVGKEHELRTRLLDSKRKLIVFDDVWESFEVEELGVPFRDASVGCKIILTSRFKDVCQEMGAHRVVEVKLLDEEEAWKLFRESAGECVDDLQLILLAKKVAKECSGLPLALVTVGKTLENEENIRVWNDSLFQLKSPGTMEIPQVLEKVYKPLRLSYDSLKTKNERDLFLLCCLFPEDHDIPIEQLTWYGIGLGMFKELGSIEEKRNRTHYYVKTLKSRHLLMDGALNDFVRMGDGGSVRPCPSGQCPQGQICGYDCSHVCTQICMCARVGKYVRNRDGDGACDNYVTMHDVVRDVAIFIGSEEKDVFVKSLKASSNLSSANCKWMSIDISKGNAELSLESGFPNLQLLMIRSHGTYANANRLGLEELKELNLLSLTSVNLMSLAPSLELPKNLTTLVLYDCQVKDISAVGKLSSLLILSIHRCGEIEEFPSDIGRLKCLKLLELIDCLKLKRIAEGVISSLYKLEELKIIKYKHIKFYVPAHKIGLNMVLKELESLPNLTSLEINRIYDPNFLAQEISLSQQLIRYNIVITQSLFHSNFIRRKLERNITLSLLDEDTEMGNWIRQLVRSTQTLRLEGDGSNNINLAQIEDLRHLELTRCSTVKKLGKAIDCKFLPVLEQLRLSYLPKFEAVVDDDIIPEGSNSFQKLETLFLDGLPELGYLWKSLGQNISLGNLKIISIASCDKLCHLFSVARARSLVQLEELDIRRCEKIEQVFMNEIESNRGNASIINVELPKLKHLWLTDLPNLQVLSQMIECPQLTELQVWNCPKFRTKIGNCCTRQLKKLHIDNCKEIFSDGIGDVGTDRHIIFSELRDLTLRNLPRVTSLFSRGVGSIKFPKLERMTIIDPDSTNDDYDHESLHLFCNSQVEVPNVIRRLSLSALQDTIVKIWCSHIPINFFHNLGELDIFDVNGIRNLMSYSIAKNLVNLQELSIKRCKEMIDVIEDEEATIILPLFPKLKCLTLQHLGKLKSFCKWTHDIELPSLETVRIEECDEMKTFTSGRLITQKVSVFFINYKKVETKDLNRGVSDYCISKIQIEEDMQQQVLGNS